MVPVVKMKLKMKMKCFIKKSYYRSIDLIIYPETIYTYQEEALRQCTTVQNHTEKGF